VGQRAETAREGYSGGEYLYESIAYPQAHMVEGYQGNIMPGNYKQRLSSQELADLVAFLMTR
jgi:cytochrome c1